MKARAARAGVSVAAILLGAALLFGVNYLGSRRWARFDWTKTRLYSLSETTTKMVRGLTSPVRITVFMTERSRLYSPVRELLNRYRVLSPRIEIEYLDPQKNPARAQALVQEFGIRQNTVVFRSGDRKKYVEEDKLAEYDFAGGMPNAAPNIKAFKGEEAFTSAILAVTEDRPPRVYFSAGHGEPGLDSVERGRGFAELKQTLERDNVTVATWDSLGKGTVPADADVIVVAGPRTGFLEPETAALETYLAGGGACSSCSTPCCRLPGPLPPTTGSGGSSPRRASASGVDIVVDPSNALPLVGAETLIANRYGSQPIVRPLADQQLPIIFTLARSVARVEPPPPGVTATMLVETTSEGWGETGLARLDEQIAKDPADNQAPVALAFASAPPESLCAAGGRRGEARRDPSGGEGCAAHRGDDADAQSGRRGQFALRRQRERRDGRQRELFPQLRALADRAGAADGNRAEDPGAGIPVAHPVAGPAHRALHDPGHAGPRGPARGLGLVPAPRLEAGCP